MPASAVRRRINDVSLSLSVCLQLTVAAVRAAGSDGTRATVAAATEAGAGAATTAVTVAAAVAAAATTAVVATTAAAEVDLLVWGKSHCATAPP